MRIRIHWNKDTEQWYMTTMRGRFIQEFYDCENFGRLFPKKSKFKSTTWKLKAEFITTNGNHHDRPSS
jgi:hypothetical protein